MLVVTEKKPEPELDLNGVRTGTGQKEKINWGGT